MSCKYQNSDRRGPSSEQWSNILLDLTNTGLLEGYPPPSFRCVFARWYIGPFLEKQLEKGGERGKEKLGSGGEFNHIQSVTVFCLFV